MPINIKNRVRKAGMPPGTLVYTGEKEVRGSKISVIDYNEETYDEVDVTNIDDCFQFSSDKQSVKWINVDGLTDIKTFENIGMRLGIHPLVLEDIINTEQRPKIEDFSDYFYITMKMISAEDTDLDGANEIYVEQLSIIVGANFVITFLEESSEYFDNIRDRIRLSSGKIRKMGADYLCYAIMDIVVDNYFLVLERMVEQLDLIEEKIDRNPKADSLWNIYNLRKEMIFLRKYIWPFRDVINMMIKTESELIKDGTKLYLKDIQDHMIQAIETIEIFREMLSEMLDIYLSINSNKMNEIMKLLTIISTIFIPLTFIAGVYGMNFEFMPELKMKMGYPAVLLLMFIVGAGFFAFFKRKKWI